MIKNEAWPRLWRRHLDQYLSKPPRTGFWMQSWFGRRAGSFLELGCGSGRDSVYLSQQGHAVVGTDLDGETLNELSRRFTAENISFQPADASALTFCDNQFDVVFHNGLWVLFEDDSFIVKMLREQVRVARKYVVIMVHNAENKGLVKLFETRAEQDELYDIRFFDRTHILGLISDAGIAYKSVKILKFGGRMDLLYRAKRVKKILPNVLWPIRHQAVPRLYQLESWSRVERLACVVEL
jgi:ubiquinone/menaquinone biosynthesis C-methylase UbiE